MIFQVIRFDQKVYIANVLLYVFNIGMLKKVLFFLALDKKMYSKDILDGVYCKGIYVDSIDQTKHEDIILYGMN